MMISINYNPEGFQWALSEASLSLGLNPWVISGPSHRPANGSLSTSCIVSIAIWIQ